METDGTTRVFYLRNDEGAQYVEQVYPNRKARTSDPGAIQEVESRVDAYFMAVRSSGKRNLEPAEAKRAVQASLRIQSER